MTDLDNTGKKVLKIRKISKKTLVEQVMDQIKELIASGQVKVNDLIPSESELAVMFGTGRSTVREAIKLFNYLGILKSEPGKGTSVCEQTSISTEALTWSILLARSDLFEMIELRSVLEERGLRSLEARARENPARLGEILQKLNHEVQRMEHALEVPSLQELIEADYDFHGAVIAASGSHLFDSIYRTLRSFMHEEMKKSMRPTMKEVVAEHRLYMEALQSGDSVRIHAVFVQHIEDIKTVMRQNLGL